MNCGDPEQLHTHMRKQVLSQAHEVLIGRICLIEFQHGKFRIVLGGYPFIAKIPVDFKYPLKAADHQPLEIQLRSNPMNRDPCPGCCGGF